MKSTGATPPPVKSLIFTDLDGTLLDHNTYSSAPAQPLLRLLEQLGIPVIFCTSKTFAELQSLRQALDNRHPFIVENGAAIYVPLGYFPSSRGDTGNTAGEGEHAGFSCIAFSKPRHHWQQLLNSLDDEFTGQFTSFSALGTAGIAAATGLSNAEAALANQRDFSEPLLWLGDADSKKRFCAKMHRLGANLLQGGRFLHVSGRCDKGKALHWLASVYQHQYQASVESIAAGDSANDIAMLEAADKALIVRSPAHPPPTLKRSMNLWLSEHTGPAGWAEGMHQILNL